jgi:hypothetical protein
LCGNQKDHLKPMDSLLQILLMKVEEKINRGSSGKWTNYDFEQLSESILEATNVQLSTTTLKRIWGKVKYPHAPAIQTLNTLAQYTGYTDWRDFELTNSELVKKDKEQEIAVANEPAPVQIPKRSMAIGKYLAAAVILALIVLVYVGFKRRGAPKIESGEYSFSLNKINITGVPNSVIFSYDASKSPSDSVYIVQTWDISRKTLVPKNGKNHSAIYYYPGFFNTKLIIDSTIVKRQNLQISSDGWLGLIQTPGNPIYFTKQEIAATEGVKIDSSLLVAHDIPLMPASPKTIFYNQRDLGDLMNDNFDFETIIRNPTTSADNACHKTEVLIQCKDDIIIIPLGAKGCVGNTSLTFAGTFKTSRFNDLSGFGCDLTQWTKLKVICRNRHAKIFVNDDLAFELDAADDPVGIVGVQYRFYGPAEIKYSRFWNKAGKLINLD